jgi:tetratricopeptide (TPR) repeat protein
MQRNALSSASGPDFVELPDWFRSQPAGAIEPPVLTQLLTLDFTKIHWQDFERLTLEVAQQIDELQNPRIYGRAGQDQSAIDFYGDSTIGRVCYQARRLDHNLTPGELVAAVDDFKRRGSKFAAARFVLCVARDAHSSQVLDELDRLKKANPTLIIDVYDSDRLSATLQSQREIVRRYFGPAWADAFCGAVEVQPHSVASSQGLRLVKVNECAPGWVGVHPAVTRKGAGDTSVRDDLPEYVKRDHDHDLERRLRAAAARGGFVVLIGNSSVGKTRSLYEAVRRELPDWHILLPDNASAIRTLAGKVPNKTVIWLDDTPSERFIADSGLGGLTRSEVLQFIHSQETPKQVIIVDTMWRNRYRSLTASPRLMADAIDADRYRDAREVLALAGAPIEVADQFSPSERDRAIELARNDIRMAEALQDTQFGFTQYIAGAPELVRRWRDASPYGRAVITAAIDAYRCGIYAPLAVDLLESAAIGYLTAHERASAPLDWLADALDEATVRRRGGTAPLLESTRDGALRDVRGYRVADFLLQPIWHRRGLELLPSAAWDSFARQAVDVGDLARLARSAQVRMLYAYAEPLYRRAVTVGSARVRRQLAALLEDQGRVDEALAELRSADAAADDAARGTIARLLHARGNLDELRELAKSGNEQATSRLPHLLARLGRVDELLELALSGSTDAREVLADLFAKHGRFDLLLELAADQNSGPRRQFAELLAEQERGEALRLMVTDRSMDPRWWGAHLLHEWGKETRAAAMLRRLAASGHGSARELLAKSMAAAGQLDRAVSELRELVDKNRSYRWTLITVLTNHGRIDEAIAELHAQVADESMEPVVDAIRGDDRLVAAEVEDGTPLWSGTFAAPGGEPYLIYLLGRAGRLDELRDYADAGNCSARYHLALALAKRGDLVELRARADGGDSEAHQRIGTLLVAQGRIDEAIVELRAMEAARDDRSRDETILVKTSDEDEGDLSCDLPELLADRERLGDLRAHVAAGAGGQRELLSLMMKTGLGEEARVARRWGLNPDGTTATPDDIRRSND